MTFYFYDLGTSGLNPREQRIMQFAGQRTDMALNPVGEPHNILIKLAEDIVPDPDAVLVTGITPQKTLDEGVTEAEFLKLFYKEIATPDTIFIGYNSIRFDDEFMRFLHYRNFYDPYEWQWKDGRSKWDLLDVIRMTRALRPSGIEWPVDAHGVPTNRLELLTTSNNLDHKSAHDALSDVYATVAVARMLHDKQTKLFEYLLGMRGKQDIAKLVQAQQPFVYTSGRYASEFEKTTVAVMVAEDPQKRDMLVYDLRYDPTQFQDMTAQELVQFWRLRKEEEGVRLPIKALRANRCPAVAPLGVLDKESQQRLGIDLAVIKKHRQALAEMKQFPERLLEALQIVEKARQAEWSTDEQDVDSQLYDGFFEGADKTVMSAVRAADPTEIMDLRDKLTDERLKQLLLRYKARNYFAALTPEEREEWEDYRTKKLIGGGQQSRLNKFFVRLQELAVQPQLTANQQYLLEELQLYGQTILPEVE